SEKRCVGEKVKSSLVPGQLKKESNSIRPAIVIFAGIARIAASTPGLRPRAVDSVNASFWLSTSTTVASRFFFQAEDGIRDTSVTGVQTCALPIFALAFFLRAKVTSTGVPGGVQLF